MLCVLLLAQASGLPALATEVPREERSSSAAARAVAALADAVRGAGEEIGTGLRRAAAGRWDGEDRVRVAQAARAQQRPEQAAPAAPPASRSDRRIEASVALPPPQPPGLRSFAAAAVPLRAAKAATSLDAVSLLPTINLVSLPKEPPDPSPAAVLAGTAGQYTAVYAFDACDPADPWKVFDPADPAASDLAALDHTQGFWIDATAATTLPVAGTQPAATEIPLCAGWNLIGYPLAQERPVLSALASIADRLVRVYGFDPADPADAWEVFDPAVPAWVNDLAAMRPGRGYWVLVSAAGTLRYENQGAPPAVELLAPADLAEVTAPTPVVGSVTSGLLAGWSLAARPAGEEGPFVEIAAGESPVAAATLGTFEPTLLLNGLYELRLQATDFAGQVAETSIVVAVDGQQKVGHFTLSFSDLEVPVSGLPIQVVRTYDSRDRRRGDFGVGWSLELRQGSYRNNRTPGDGWQILAGFLPCESVQETLSHLTSIRLSDHEVYRFRLRLGSPATVSGGCFAQARFDFVDGPVPGATLAILGNTEVIYLNGSNQVVDADSLEPYEPRAVRLTTRDGRVFDLDLAAGVTRLADPNGNALAIGPDGITHSAGRAIAFERDTEGRIERIVDPLGAAIVYAYDAAGDLVAVTDREGNTTRFRYDGRHDLLEIEDPRGTTPIRNDYDDAGRLVRHTDAFGKTILFGHDLAARREVVTDRTGASRVLEYDARGNVVREVDAEGHETLRTFDDRDNLLTETDPLGHTTTYTYDAANNQTSVTDALGHVTRRTFDAAGRVLTETDPRDGVTTNAYDAAGNLLTTTDALGHQTTFTYDARGNLLTETDPEGSVTTFTYDAAGNLVRQEDPTGAVTTFTHDAAGNRLTESTARTLADGTQETLTTTFTYDALGRLTSTTDPEGATSRTEYDALGNVARTVDPLGRATVFRYDEMGRLVETLHPDGTAETQAYDAEGRLLAQTDRGGRVTTFAYDALGRLTTTTFPGGAVTTNTYDDGGRLVALIDERGHTTTYEYDAAGRRTKVVDALGQETVFGYDAAGNQTSITDARGNTTTFEHDAANRMVRTVLPDGSERTVAYDAASRRTAETDAAGNVTQFSYDDAGRLLSVTDALRQVTRFAYDEVGNRVSQTDANGRTTRFAHDGAGRETSRRLPDGAAETKSYDLAGNLVSRTDFAGRTTTFAYDAANRLSRKTLPGGAVVTFTYTSTGRRATATDSRGTTGYAYDVRDRLVELTYPDGRRLLYAYDAAGNRTSLTAVVGETSLVTTSTYDPLGRLDTVIDPDGRVYDHAYDANGNRAELAHPNGVTTTYTYDAANRLTSLGTIGPGGSAVQSYGYTLGPAGNRTAVLEHDGTTRAYTYDALFRLTRERVTGGTEPVIEDVFTYDPVGNRLRRDRTDAGGTSVTASTYDVRDRLLTVGAETLTWDANGNLTAKSGPDGATYTWDAEDLLVAVEQPDGTVVTHAYDADGNRVRTEITPPTGPPTVRELLLDTSGPLSHEVTETDAGGELVAYYVRGDDLLAVLRPATGPRFFHADGLGSIRALTDEAGAVTDRYTFTAFGELLNHQGSDENAYLFAGEPLDPNSGFYYLRARWMEPGVGRFVSMDPFGGILLEPASLHRYLYSLVNPVDRVDPSGEYSFNLTSIAVVGSLISGLVGGIINAIGAKTPGEFVGRFLIGFIANSVATYIAFYVGNPLAQGAIAGGLSQVFTLLWESRHDLSGLLSLSKVMEVLVAALIGAFGGGVVGQRVRRALIPAHKDIWQNVWKARTLNEFSKNVQIALGSGAVGGAVTTSVGRLILPRLESVAATVNLDRYFSTK